jgi:hypothetical protein
VAVRPDGLLNLIHYEVRELLLHLRVQHGCRAPLLGLVEATHRFPHFPTAAFHRTRRPVGHAERACRAPGGVRVNVVAHSSKPTVVHALPGRSSRRFTSAATAPAILLTDCLCWSERKLHAPPPVTESGALTRHAAAVAL